MKIGYEITREEIQEINANCDFSFSPGSQSSWYGGISKWIDGDFVEINVRLSNHISKYSQRGDALQHQFPIHYTGRSINDLIVTLTQLQEQLNSCNTFEDFRNIKSFFYSIK